MRLDTSSKKWRPFCPEGDELTVLSAQTAMLKTLKTTKPISNWAPKGTHTGLFDVPGGQD